MRLKLAPLALVLCFAQSGLGQQGSLQSGRWSAGVLQSAWSLDNWGDECGPSPVGGSEAGGIVNVTQAGNEVTIAGLGRSFTSNSCWDQQPGVAPVSHTAGARQWTTTCRSAPGDPRRVTVTTSLVLNGTNLDLDEVGRYEVAIAGRQCAASVRRSRRYVLIQGEGEAPVAASSTPEKALPSCAQPGPVTRIEASPMYKLLRLGEQFSFSARLLDEKGCVVAQKVSWRFTKPYEGVQLDANGNLSVLPNAPEGEVQVSAGFAEHSVQMVVYVVSAKRYTELLSSPSFNPAGESQARSVETFVPSVVGSSRVTEIETTARRRRAIFVWAVAALAVLLGATALILSRRRRHWVPNNSAERSLKARKAVGAYSDTTQTREPIRQICPVCGTQYDAQSQFCGKDGATLVPLN